jgi:hypothetical protein
MTLTRYLIFLGVSTIICWASWLLVIFRISPYSSGQWGFIFFYATQFFAVAGTASLIGFGARALLHRNQAPYQIVATSFRQGVLFASVATASAWLQSQRLLAWWSLVLIALVAAGVEAFVRASRDSSRSL